MQFPLRDLSETEKETVMNAPIWVGIMIGCADGNLSQNEVERIEEVISTKTFSEKNDVHYLYKEIVEGGVAAQIKREVEALEGSAEDKAHALVEKLSGLNAILPKLGQAYAVQFRDSLHDVAVAVSKAAGGVLGIGTISVEEKELLDLPMIDKH